MALRCAFFGCDEPPVKVVGAVGALELECGAGHRTPLSFRCPGCMRRQIEEVSDGRVVCARCARAWRIVGGELREAHLPEVAAAPRAALEVDARRTADAGGYRDANALETLELRVPERTREVVGRVSLIGLTSIAPAMVAIGVAWLLVVRIEGREPVVLLEQLEVDEAELVRRTLRTQLATSSQR